MFLIKMISFLITFPVLATVFQLRPIDQQIREADAIIIGHYLRSKSVRLDDGKIVTQMIFKMDKEMGLNSSGFNTEEIIVHYPGGEIGDERVRVEGVPRFIPGENVIIMIKNSPDRYWGMNLGFGTFKVVNYGNQKLIINTLFPEDLRVGQMVYSEFEEKVKIIKSSGFKIVSRPYVPVGPEEINQGRSPASTLKGKNRAIASSPDKVENNSMSGYSTFWLLIILAAMGATYRVFRQRQLR